MRNADIQLTNELINKLELFQEIIPIPGIADEGARDCFVRQIVDSVRRIRYVTVIRNKNLSECVYDPASIGFDPIKAAVKYMQDGNLEEAAWMVFLSVHFGKNKRTKWKLTANVYGALHQQAPWTWDNIRLNVIQFRNWLNQNEVEVKSDGKFGNHNKYQSISGTQHNGTGHVISTYVDWIVNAGGHANLFTTALNNNQYNPRNTFADLYNSMTPVARFGRTARFDYLTMVGKIGIAAIEPDSTYLSGSTGPLSGAALLFGSQQSPSTYNQWLDTLEAHLGLYFGMQVLEDSLCNWQKSPNNYIYFGG